VSSFPSCRLPCLLGLSLVLALLPLGSADAGPVERLEKKIVAGRPDVAIRGAARLLEKDLDSGERRALRGVLRRALLAQLEREPDLVLAQWYLEEFPRGTEVSWVRGVAASQALREASRLGTEAAFLGVQRQYPGTEAALTARRRAQEELIEELGPAASADALHGYLLRYPRGKDAAAIRDREHASAWETAEDEGTVTSWGALLDRYPGHPRFAEAEEQLQETAWSELSSGTPGVAELWEYAGRFPSTERGWEAASEGLSSPLELKRGAGWEAGQPSPHSLSAVTVELPAVPPAGFRLDIRVEVRVAAASEEWTPWPDHVEAVAGQVGLPSPLETPPKTRSRFRARELHWGSDHSLCTVSEEPLEARARVILARGERRAERTLEFSVGAACPGARQMVFGRLGDDLLGPAAVLTRAVGPEQSWWTEAPGGRLPEAWDCSHIAELDSAGARVACGPLEARVGWHRGGLWVRETPRDQRSTQRVELLPLEPVSGLPLSVRKRRGKSQLLDPSKRVLLELGSHEPVLTPTDSRRTFGRPVDAPVSPLEGLTESPGPGGIPVPEESSPETLTLATEISAPLRQLVSAAFPGARVSQQPFSLPGSEADFGFVIPLGSLRGVRPDGTGAQAALLLPGPGAWRQLLWLPEGPAPGDAPWVAFRTPDGTLCLRTVQASTASQPARLLTVLRMPEAWVLEVRELPR